jgi:hypothetical protein
LGLQLVPDFDDECGDENEYFAADSGNNRMIVEKYHGAGGYGYRGNEQDNFREFVPSFWHPGSPRVSGLIQFPDSTLILMVRRTA